MTLLRTWCGVVQEARSSDKARTRTSEAASEKQGLETWRLVLASKVYTTKDISFNPESSYHVKATFSSRTQKRKPNHQVCSFPALSLDFSAHLWRQKHSLTLHYQSCNLTHRQPNHTVYLHSSGQFSSAADTWKAQKIDFKSTLLSNGILNDFFQAFHELRAFSSSVYRTHYIDYDFVEHDLTRRRLFVSW